MSDQAATSGSESLVKTWRVTAWVGMVVWEVDAEDADAAIQEAIDDPAFMDGVLDAATWEAVEVSS